MNATPTRRVRITFSLGLLSMIIGLVFLQRSVDHIRSGGPLQDRAYEWLQAGGLFLLVISFLTIAFGAIYGARKLVAIKAGTTGAVCVGIAATFWWFISYEGGINTHDWTLALVIPEFVWTAAGIILLLASIVRFMLEKSHG